MKRFACVAAVLCLVPALAIAQTPAAPPPPPQQGATAPAATEPQRPDPFVAVQEDWNALQVGLKHLFSSMAAAARENGELRQALAAAAKEIAELKAKLAAEKKPDAKK